MKDKSKRLTVVNTDKKKADENASHILQQKPASALNAAGFNPALYLLKSVWDSVFEIKTDVSGQKYLFGKLPMVTQYGVTMYGDNDELNLPSIYEGLPIDNVTLYWDNGVLKAKGGEGGGGGVADSIAWANVYGKPSWITDTKPIYNYSEIKNTPDLSVFVTGTALSNTLADYATLTYLTGELKKYVTIKDDQDIVGVKNFLNGIKISNMPIRKMQDDVIYIDANLVVRGGVTMYSDNEADIPTIKDEIGFAGYNGSVGLASFDSSQFVISSNGTVSVKGGSTGLDTAQLKDYLDSNKYTTETWVKAQGYASASSLSSLQTKVDNFLEGSDTDTVINKWKELETFLSGLTESDNLSTILTGKADKSYVDTNFVTIAGTEDVTGLHNFVNGLEIGGLPIIKKQDDVVYLDANLVVRGGITMYAENEVNIPSILDSLPIASNTALGIASFDSTYFSVDSNGMVTLTSAPSSGASSLGELLNVDASIDATASVDRVLYQPAGSAMWTWRELPKDGVVGDYLPLSGGTLTGGVVIAPSASYTTAITDSCTVLKLGSDTSSMNGYNSGLGFNALQRYSSNYLQHLHAWIGLSPCIDSAGSELYDLVFATNGSTTGETSPIERMRITHDGSVKIQKLFFGNTNEINSLDGVGLCLNYEGAGYTFIGNNGYSTIVGSWSSTTSSQQNVLKGATLSVFGTIFGYRYGKKASGAAFMFDKPGANYTGIGADGTTDTIYFGACNQDGDWVFHNQIWKFGGSIVCGALKIWDTNVIDGVGGSTVHLNYYETSDVTFCKGGGTTIAFGNLLTHGGITMYSDQRKKTILNHVELSLKQIADAPLIQHYYNSDQNKTIHVGSIAQYWAELNDWFCKLDTEGYYTMEIQNCALASAISIARHLEKYESKTDKKIRMLKKRVQELEDKLEKLEGGNYGC